MPHFHIYSNTELPYEFSQGNEQAFRQLFDEFMQPLCYFARQLIHNKEEAEDIVSQAFQKLWAGHKGFTSIGGIKSFLYTAVRNHCFNYLKHLKVVQNVQDHLPENEEAWADARIIHTEAIRKVYAEIEALSPHYRNIIILSIVHDLSTKEIAKRLNVTESHVRADKSRAIVYLRTALIKKDLLHIGLLLLAVWKLK